MSADALVNGDFGDICYVDNVRRRSVCHPQGKFNYRDLLYAAYNALAVQSIILFELAYSALEARIAEDDIRQLGEKIYGHLRPLAAHARTCAARADPRPTTD